MSRYIDDLELQIWLRELEKAMDEKYAAKREFDDDPSKIILDCNIKFAKLLEENKGEARHTKIFENQVSYLNKLQKRAEARLATYDLGKVMDKLSQAEKRLSEVSIKYNNIKLMYTMKYKDSIIDE